MMMMVMEKTTKKEEKCNEKRSNITKRAIVAYVYPSHQHVYKTHTLLPHKNLINTRSPATQLIREATYLTENNRAANH